MNDFTKGEWIANGAFVESDSGEEIVSGVFNAGRKELHANAKLIATAGTTATKLAEQGYDAVKVLELLPMLEQYIGTAEYHKAFDLLVKCRAKTDGVV